MHPFSLLAAIGVSLASAVVSAQPAVPVGEIKGTAWTHTRESLALTATQADVVLPASVTGASVYSGKFKDAPKGNGHKVPVVVFLHGSSGLGLKAIGEWQLWLASLGYASAAPDSFVLADHVTYKSPIDKAAYERIHALRQSEIAPMLAALATQPWADMKRLILAGTSEGAVPVARHTGSEFVARMLFAWSCENNYFVVSPNNAFEPGRPVLNVISATDPFFSKSNTWLGSADATGHCGPALKGNASAAVVLVPDAPHTLLNLPAARVATSGFLRQVAAP
jgi:dienelactone hydrolase